MSVAEYFYHPLVGWNVSICPAPVSVCYRFVAPTSLFTCCCFFSSAVFNVILLHLPYDAECHCKYPVLASKLYSIWVFPFNNSLLCYVNFFSLYGFSEKDTGLRRLVFTTRSHRVYTLFTLKTSFKFWHVDSDEKITGIRNTWWHHPGSQLKYIANKITNNFYTWL